MNIVYGSGRTRITLYNSSGVATYRITLQTELVDGLQLTFQAEGQEHLLGSGANWARKWTHRGFRPLLSIQWDWAMSSSIETWTPGTPGSWGTSVEESTAQSLGRIQSSSMVYPALVEPHLDKSFSFSSQPDPTKPLILSDRRKVLHGQLTLDLIATSLINAIPVW